MEKTVSVIPKKIHYCWFGRNPKPKMAEKCIRSWKKYLKGYEIIEWNEDNYDISQKPHYVREAYENKKWAYVSDYARFDILFQYGGVYFDTDVEVIRDMSRLLEKGAFMGCEKDGLVSGADEKSKGKKTVNPGLGIAVAPGLGIYKEILDSYQEDRFILEDGSFNYKTIVTRTTDILIGHGLKNICEIQNVGGITIYPTEYFCPKSFEDGIIRKTSNTYSIHHFDSSWYTEEQQQRKKQKWDKAKQREQREKKKRRSQRKKQVRNIIACAVGFVFGERFLAWLKNKI